MRRFIVVCLTVLLGLPLVAATPLPSLYVKPNVVVFPFTANGSSVNREASSRLATIIATQMAGTGYVTVVPPPPGTDRKDFLNVARANSADYYVSGYISPLGDGVSIVEQVVGTVSGIVVFSTTAQLKTYADAAGQGDDLAAFITRHANRGLAAIGTPPPASSPTPAPSAAAEANLGKLFGRRKKTAATPVPRASPAAAAAAPAAALRNVTPVPSPVALMTPLPSAAPHDVTSPATASGYAVLPVAGTSADASLRDAATNRLLERTHGSRAESAASACAAHPVRAVLYGILAVQPDAVYGGSSALFELQAMDCAGKQLWRQTFGRDAGGDRSAQIATERAVDAAIGAYLNPRRRRAL